jgi:hypothetical protein
MSYTHDKLAFEAAELLLSQLQKNQAPWANGYLTNRTTRWQGIADWPRPDAAFQDKDKKVSLAIEFKPPGQPKREYVTGVGQAMTYLRTFTYAALIVPRFSNDGFEIAQYLKGHLNEFFAVRLPIGLFMYKQSPGDSTDLESLIDLRLREGEAPRIPRGVGKRFWRYWRDLSQHDLLTILTEMDSSNQTFDLAFKKFWDNQMAEGVALTWEGNYRKPKPKSKDALSYESERTSANSSLRGIGVMNTNGKLTEEGIRLLQLGKVYGASSAAFLRYFGRLILENGQHLELIFWIENQQRKMAQEHKESASLFYKKLGEELYQDGIITRVPKGGGKKAFLRDEPKLWHKFGLLAEYGPRGYFHRGIGFIFDWRAIISMVGY